MSTGILLVAGLISGFCSSAPLGPINLWLVEALIHGAKKGLFWFLAGVIFVDLLFAFVAVWGYYEYLKDTTYVGKAQLIAGVFLILVGVVSLVKLLRQRRGPQDEHVQDTRMNSPVKNFVFGASLCGSNPGFLMFWLFVVNFLNNTADLTVSISAHILFLVGVAVGDSLWFGLLAKIVSKGINLAKPSILLTIRYGISLSFLVFGGVTVFRSF